MHLCDLFWQTFNRSLLFFHVSCHSYQIWNLNIPVEQLQADKLLQEMNAIMKLNYRAEVYVEECVSITWWDADSSYASYINTVFSLENTCPLSPLLLSWLIKPQISLFSQSNQPSEVSVTAKKLLFYQESKKKIKEKVLFENLYGEDIIKWINSFLIFSSI